MLLEHKQIIQNVFKGDLIFFFNFINYKIWILFVQEAIK